MIKRVRTALLAAALTTIAVLSAAAPALADTAASGGWCWQDDCITSG
ncbi:hypothetical protein CLV63_1513 [Murinocardiopsis flavida]|uniref:Uncharacterized protein n=1 Tax=Murinocardiopsis flavida TaxID=645275 RepID=A0A2P8C7F7_9ACTN|nr:hypothetical protein [Murinocardiopsis flavida]PSK80857.1 hypothetical protein CLV63_1513 [Murinocardiopsis flavida]